jgi:hypothetical protein
LVGPRVACGDNALVTRFDAPILEPDGKKLVTLRDAIKNLGETIPKSEQAHPRGGRGDLLQGHGHASGSTKRRRCATMYL